MFGRHGFVSKLLQVSIVGDNNQAVIQLGPAVAQDDDAKQLQGHCEPMGPYSQRLKEVSFIACVQCTTSIHMADSKWTYILHFPQRHIESDATPRAFDAAFTEALAEVRLRSTTNNRLLNLTGLTCGQEHGD